LEEYGVFENDCIAVTNAIKAHHPRAVVFLSCTPKVLDTLRKHLPDVDVIVLDEFDQSKLCQLPGFKKRPVEVDSTYLRHPRRGHVVAVEKDQPMSLVIGSNLAAALGAELCLLPAVADEMVESITDRLRT
jgi:hypothetical protein